MKGITQEMRNGIMVQIEVPECFIGLWCIANVYGTHGSYHTIGEDGMVFTSKSHAEAYRDSKYKGKDINLAYYEVMQIDKTYPVWQKRMYICGLSEKEIKSKK